MRFRRQPEPPFDPKEICTVIRVSAGAGGADAIAWAALLQRAYVLWAQKCSLGVDHEPDALIVCAPAGPYFSLEPGVHRLVRRSPFDPGNRRHTCFAQVFVNGETSGEQVRSYVLEPYTRVGPTGGGDPQTDDAQGVLDGDFSAFYPDAA